MPTLEEIFVKKSLGSVSVRKGFSQIGEELLASAMQWHMSKMSPSTQLEIVSEYLAHCALTMENHRE